MQRLVFCYHKTGTVLFGNVLRLACARLGLSFQERFGFAASVEGGADVVLLAHGLLGALPAGPFRAVRVVRDPRDVWVSGYLYHLHCREPWCVNEAVAPNAAIRFPQVPMAFVHRRERWKRDWLARLEGRSYQANLRARGREAGLDFELAGYAGATLEDMAEWRFGSVVPDVRLEEVAADFDGAWARVFAMLGFDERAIPGLVGLAAAEDVGRMSDAAVAARPHIHGRAISKWRGVLSPAQARGFAQRHDALLAGLRYPQE
jgi:hypothetical protein